MICKNIKKICKDYKQIENYQKAIRDKNNVWHCHHKLEIHEDYLNSKDDLIAMGLYYNRPPEELIFLTPEEHGSLHQNSMVGKSITHMSRPNTKTQEVKDKIRDANLKRFYGDEHTIEQVEDHRREKNTERLGRWRNRHRKHYTSYQCDYQADFRKNHPNYYSTYKKYVKDRDCGNYDGTFKEWLAENGLKYEDL